jgi:uncharacterized phage protein (TIGR01671 family)
MREIKFRAWVDGEMYADVGLLPLSGGERFSISRHKWKFRPDEAELMQYTGINDKNGVEIYEGDILGLVHKKHGRQNTKKVVWDEVHACFDWEDANGDSWPDGFTGFYDEYQVIGNIYKNPELLK